MLRAAKLVDLCHDSFELLTFFSINFKVYRSSIVSLPEKTVMLTFFFLLYQTHAMLCCIPDIGLALLLCKPTTLVQLL
jgi:hypothetical protein